ncbi:MAG: folylpolyglutamate synthase/dihydrofolate synthase family protein [candidate division WOR-3 bacterium]
MIEPKLFKNLYNLEHRPVKTYNFDLKKFKNFLKEFSSPENDIGEIIHVAGTNGKGSVVGIISQILIESSYKVGTYTSPHIKYVNERIKVNNRMISDKDFKKYEKLIYEKIKNKCKDYRTFFEAITTLAFLYFKDKKVDYSVLEVGLGGRLDSTNVVEKSLSVITKIDYDHTHLLGDTIEKITFEKGGIIKKNSVVFTFKQSKNVLDVLRNIADKRKSKLIVVDTNDYIRKTNGFFYNDEFYRFLYPYSYQIENAILSLNIAKFLGISEKYIKKGIENFKIEGRGEIISENPLIIVDGSHNPAAVERTLRELKELYPERKINSISVFMSDKDYKKSIEILKKYASKIFLTEINFFRCAKIKDYEKIKGVNLFESPEDALKNAMEKNSIILFIGSFYLIEKAKRIVKNYGF